MPESNHADWLRELGFKDFGTNPCRAELHSGEKAMMFSLPGVCLKPGGPRPPCFFLAELDLDGIVYTLSMAVDELFHQWVFFSDVRTIRPEELTDLGYSDETMRLSRIAN